MNLSNILGLSLSIFNNIKQSKSSKKELKHKKIVDEKKLSLKKKELECEEFQNEMSTKTANSMFLPYLNLDIDKSRIYLTDKKIESKGKIYPQFFIELKFNNIGKGPATNIQLLPLKKESGLYGYIETEYYDNFHVISQFMEPHVVSVRDTASCKITIDFDKYSKVVPAKSSTRYINSIFFKVGYEDIRGKKYYQEYTILYDVEIRNGKISNKYPLTQNYTVSPPKEIKD